MSTPLERVRKALEDMREHLGVSGIPDALAALREMEEQEVVAWGMRCRKCALQLAVWDNAIIGSPYDHWDLCVHRPTLVPLVRAHKEGE